MKRSLVVRSEEMWSCLGTEMHRHAVPGPVLSSGPIFSLRKPEVCLDVSLGFAMTPGTSSLCGANVICYVVLIIASLGQGLLLSPA